MQFDFSDEQKELRTQIRRFFDDQSPTSVARRVIDGDEGYDTALWAKLGEAGFLSAALPVEHGGAGAGYLEACIVAEEAGRALAPVPLLTSIHMAAELIMLAGDEAQKAQWLPRLASGEVIATVAVAEETGTVLPKRVGAQVAGGRLTGVKLPVMDGGIAHLAIVLAGDDKGALKWWLADLSGPGVERVAIKTIDGSRKQARLVFDGASVEPLGQAGDGWALWQRVLDRSAILTAFQQIGGAEAALMTARDYALERFAFGRQIGSFQAIKHMLADMYVALELARSNAYYGAWALAADAPELPQAAAAARVSATTAYQRCAADNIQVHGGMGFTWEFDCHLHYRRSNYLAIALGGQSHWESRLVECLRDGLKEKSQ
jgi:alkylation response protein AidB-like acyl-CoA dehydrogenase